MALNAALIAELKQEASNTRKMLERIPAEKYGFKPHNKSMSMMVLAGHVAEIPSYANAILEATELDFAKLNYTPPAFQDNQSLLASFDKLMGRALTSLQETNDDKLMQPWTLRDGDRIYFTLPKMVALRNLVFNHLIHHRGQLSVYLRLNDIPVPGMYGPSADEKS